MVSDQPAQSWRGYINQLTYGADLQTSVDDSLINRLADELILRRLFSDPVAAYYEAAIQGLRSGERLRFNDDQDESAVRDLLMRLVSTLDERRPWPEPPFKTLEGGEWLTLRDAPLIGRIPIRPRNVGAYLNHAFPEGGPDGRVIVLQLRTGQKVGLRVTSLRDPNVEVYSQADPEATRESFRELTGLDVQPA